MRGVLTGWAAFAGVGLGVLHVAIATGAPWPEAAVLCLLAALELVWAVAVMRTGRVVLPRATLATALAPLVAAAVVLTLGPTVLVRSLPAAALAAAAVLSLFVAGCAGVRLRRGPAPANSAGGGAGPGRYLLGMFAGALLVGALCVPAAAAAQAGRGGSAGTTVMDMGGHEH